MQLSHEDPRRLAEREIEPDTLDALVTSSRNLVRFWPPLSPAPQPATASPAGVKVPSGAQRVVAGMPEYGG